MNAVPLIATVGVLGAGAAYYYYQMYCPDSNMSRNDDGDCECNEGYYPDPDEDDKCIARPTTESSECKGVLIAGKYIYDPDGADLTDILADEATDVQIDCLLCNACEGSSRQAQDGRCLRCMTPAIQQEYRDEDDSLLYGTSSGEGAAGSGGDEGAGWIQDYELEQAAKATPANPLSADYEWLIETTVEDSEAESYASETVPPLYTPYTYRPASMEGFVTTDKCTLPWGM